jgi:pentatricopeptide repeat protein
MKRLLLYNLHSIKGSQIHSLCTSLGLCAIHVESFEYLEQIGAVAEQPGFLRAGVPPCGPSFSEEMILFCNMDPEEVFRFLKEMKKRGIQPVDLKAILTPHNVCWNSLQLHQELLKEHGIVNGGKYDA